MTNDLRLDIYLFRFKTFGSRDPHRPPEDVAYSVARFFQKGGSLHNYYMVNVFKLIFIHGYYYFLITFGYSIGLVQYHGGTNFGRTSGGPFITTSYDYDAPIDEYG